MLVSLAALALLAPSSASADLAHGKPATASSTYSSTYQPGYAVDGDSNTRWSSNFTDNQWWQVDLGSLQQVNAVAINWENAYASHYRISVSTDGTNFTTVSDVNITKPGSQQTSFSTVSARYVRITGVTRATQYGISFWEAQVYGPSSPAPSGPLPSGFRDSAVFTGLANPTALRF